MFVPLGMFYDGYLVEGKQINLYHKVLLGGHETKSSL